MLLVLDRSDSVPLYRQLSLQLKGLIESGTLAPGTRLPTVRRLAEDHGLTRLTVQSAFSELQDQGWIQSTVGRGTFVSAQSSAPPPSRLEIPGSLAELLQALDAATLLILGELWLNREAGTFNGLSPGVRLILDGIKERGYA